MHFEENDILLRIMLGENDMLKGRPLYECIVQKARELNLAGATVLRGIMGFGADSRMHSAKLLSISSDLPIVIEIVDTKENIDRLMPFLDEHLEEGIVTMEAVHVHKYRHR
jgi:PII-like signaling protein